MPLIDIQDGLSHARQHAQHRSKRSAGRTAAVWLLALLGLNAAVWWGVQPTAPILDTAAQPLPNLQADTIVLKNTLKTAKPAAKSESKVEPVPAAEDLSVENARLDKAPDSIVANSNEPVLDTAKPEAAKPEPESCWQWGTFNPEQTQQARRLLAQSKLPAFTTLTSSQALPYAVQLGPYPNEARTRAKLALLKKADYDGVVVGEQNTIVVAQLSTQSAARALKQKLDALDLGGASVVAQNNSVEMTRYQFKSLQEPQRVSLINLSKKIGTVLPCSAA